MFANSVTLEVDSPEQEALLRRFHAFLQEMQHLALTAPEGRILDVCEAAVLAKGQEVNRQVLQQAVQERIGALEKKGRRCGVVPAVGPGKTATGASARSGVVLAFCASGGIGGAAAVVAPPSAMG